MKDIQHEPLATRIAAGLNKIGLAMKQQSWQKANEEGLSATQGQILTALVGKGPLSGTELGERLGLTLPTISDAVRALFDKGLVSRSPDPRHPRASLLAPTKKGAALGAKARSWPEFMADAAAELSPEEQRGFYAGVLRMIRNLQSQGMVPLTGMCLSCVHFRPHVRAGKSPHHCALMDAPLSEEELRVDCPDQAPQLHL